MSYEAFNAWADAHPILFGVYFWLISAPIVYVMAWTGSDEVNSRLHVERGVCMSKVSFWRYQKEALKLMWHTLFELHCPWDWRICVKHRVAHVRVQLRNHTHEMGWNLKDCDNPKLHGEIARTCFDSRPHFWVGEVFQMFTFLPRLMIFFALMLIICLVIAPIYELGSWVRYRFFPRPEPRYGRAPY
jgi:hypothetical protein